MTLKDQRIKLMNEILNGIKVIMGLPFLLGNRPFKMISLLMWNIQTDMKMLPFNQEELADIRHILYDSARGNQGLKMKRTFTKIY